MATLFPHLTSTGPAPSHREVMDAYRAAFSLRVKEGSLRPFVLPYNLYGCLLLLVYLCIPHTNQRIVYKARWVVLLLLSVFQWQSIWETTSMSMAVGFGTGLIGAWGIVWSFTWLVWNRPQFDAKRVERRWVR